MIALLSGAWWAQRLGGPALQALGATLAIAAVVITVGLGLVWLREDARTDARSANKSEREALRAENGALRAAAQQQATTLRLRAEAMEMSQEALAELRREMEEKRNASPDPDAIVIPPGDPWLGPRRSARPADGVRKP
jgi:hypothetical protein